MTTRHSSRSSRPYWISRRTRGRAGMTKVEGREEVYQIWVGRDWRVLYSITADRNELIIEAIA